MQSLLEMYVFVLYDWLDFNETGDVGRQPQKEITLHPNILAIFVPKTTEAQTPSLDLRIGCDNAAKSDVHTLVDLKGVHSLSPISFIFVQFSVKN